MAGQSTSPGVADESRRTSSRTVPPQGPWTGKADPWIYLTAAGLILVNDGGIYDRTDGIYLFVGSKTVHLLSGRVSEVGVSQDGCSIAFSHAPRYDRDYANAENARTLKQIHLCRGKIPMISESLAQTALAVSKQRTCQAKAKPSARTINGYVYAQWINDPNTGFHAVIYRDAQTGDVQVGSRGPKGMPLMHSPT